MKRTILITVLAFGTIVVACSRQKALDRILADPQMKSYLLSEMLKSQPIRAELADSIFADNTIVNKYLDGLVGNDISRDDLLNRMLRVDPSGEWIVNKLVQNDNIKQYMKKVTK